MYLDVHPMRLDEGRVYAMQMKYIALRDTRTCVCVCVTACTSHFISILHANSVR